MKLTLIWNDVDAPYPKLGFMYDQEGSAVVDVLAEQIEDNIIEYRWIINEKISLPHRNLTYLIESAERYYQYCLRG